MDFKKKIVRNRVIDHELDDDYLLIYKDIDNILDDIDFVTETIEFYVEVLLIH